MTKKLSPFTQLKYWFMGKNQNFPNECINSTNINSVLAMFGTMYEFTIFLNNNYNNYDSMKMDKVNFYNFLKETLESFPSYINYNQFSFFKNSRSKYDKEINEINEKYPLLKTHEVSLLMDIFKNLEKDNSKEIKSIYESLDKNKYKIKKRRGKIKHEPTEK